MNFVFDTETTGLPARKSYDDYYAPENLEKYDKSRIVSIAWILFSGPRIISKNYFVIRPEGFLIGRSIKSYGNSRDHTGDC